MNTFSTSSANLSATLPSLGRVGRDPSRLMTIREWWHEMGQPIEMLADPQATFHDDERGMIALCQRDGIAYRSAPDDGLPTAFPAWRLAMFYQSP